MRIKPKDRVLIRPDFLHAVSGYQVKPLGYRRLVGEVKEVQGDRAKVDFAQRDLPRVGGRLFGERVRHNKNYGGRGDDTLPVEMLEKVD